MWIRVRPIDDDDDIEITPGIYRDYSKKTERMLKRNPPPSTCRDDSKHVLILLQS